MKIQIMISSTIDLIVTFPIGHQIMKYYGVL